MIDLTLALGPTTPRYPGDPPPVRRLYADLRAGDRFTASQLTCSVHAGTHVDAPAHFLPDGQTVDQIAPDRYSGRAHVVQIRPGTVSMGAHIVKASLSPDAEVLLLHTRVTPWTRGEEPGPRLSVEGATALVEWRRAYGKLKAVGIDALSVEDDDPTFAVHRVLLEGGVFPIETLNLETVNPGPYQLWCLPLRVEHGDGAPCRAILLPLSRRHSHSTLDEAASSANDLRSADTLASSGVTENALERS